MVGDWWSGLRRVCKEVVACADCVLLKRSVPPTAVLTPLQNVKNVVPFNKLSFVACMRGIHFSRIYSFSFVQRRAASTGGVGNYRNGESPQFLAYTRSLRITGVFTKKDPRIISGCVCVCCFFYRIFISRGTFTLFAGGTQEAELFCRDRRLQQGALFVVPTSHTGGRVRSVTSARTQPPLPPPT